MGTIYVLIFALFSLNQVEWSAGNIPRPRGVAISKAGAYDPTQDFHCLDGSKSIPFEYVNDDYCDCSDGSDEPGTSACPNGWFHCTNAGHIPLNIVSSRVNDGICDCCDGSDEYEGIITCSNTCKQLGKKAKEEAEKRKVLVEAAMKVKVQYIDEGKKSKEEKKVRLSQLEVDRVSTEEKRTDLEAKKTEAESPETEAKDRHEEAWKEEKERRAAEREGARAEEAFKELDVNSDYYVDFPEMSSHLEFDIDGNGDVSEEEAKEYMEEMESVDFNIFKEKIWGNIKDIYKRKVERVSSTATSPGDQAVEPPSGEIPSLDDIREGLPEEQYDDDEEDSDDEDRGDEGEPEESENKREDEEDEKMPDYDEETKVLIQAADEARARFNEADEELKNLDKEISDIKSFLDLDMGPNDEFYFLREKCFEMTDREYIYKLCPFERATQRPKTGGAETTLGNWGHWSGPENDKYSSMKYDRGQHCWNGPDRSVEVKLHCGLENLLTSASEPNRCEYQFDFTTPALCVPMTSESQTHPPHTEL